MRSSRPGRGRRGIDGRSPAAVGAILALLALSGMGMAVSTPASPALGPLAQFDAHIDHIVFLIQENHAYDSIYGEYCRTLGPYCTSVGNGIPNGTCIPKNPAKAGVGCVAPYNFTAKYLSPPNDLPHNWASTHIAWNNGSMNGFYVAERNPQESLGHYNATTTPVYWDLAEEYGLGDDFFSPVMSYSLPNHWYAVAAKAPSVVYKARLYQNYVNWSRLTHYLNQSNSTMSIEQELTNSTVSWDWFDYPLTTYAQEISHRHAPSAFDYWNPLASAARSYAPGTISHFQNRSAFFGDAANGTLPNISWIIPAPQDSDHPPFNVTNGQDWIANVVDALEQSPEWNSTVLFITWDEYGGFYDHVAPPILSPYGDGFRVPLLAISPWVQQGVIDSQQMDFDSILHLMGERFGLPCLDPRDCRAKLPLGMFDFHMAPRAPIEIFPYNQSAYPMPLESSGQLPYYSLSTGAAAVAYRDPPPLPASEWNNPNIDWS